MLESWSEIRTSSLSALKPPSRAESCGVSGRNALTLGGIRISLLRSTQTTYLTRKARGGPAWLAWRLKRVANRNRGRTINSKGWREEERRRRGGGGRRREEEGGKGCWPMPPLPLVSPALNGFFLSQPFYSQITTLDQPAERSRSSRADAAKTARGNAIH